MISFFFYQTNKHQPVALAEEFKGFEFLQRRFRRDTLCTLLPRPWLCGCERLKRQHAQELVQVALQIQDLRLAPRQHALKFGDPLVLDSQQLLQLPECAHRVEGVVVLLVVAQLAVVKVIVGVLDDAQRRNPLYCRQL